MKVNPTILGWVMALLLLIAIGEKLNVKEAEKEAKASAEYAFTIRKNYREFVRDCQPKAKLRDRLEQLILLRAEHPHSVRGIYVWDRWEPDDEGQFLSWMHGIYADGSPLLLWRRDCRICGFREFYFGTNFMLPQTYE
jgi:hypothetical protein